MRVLIVEDNRRLAESIRDILKHWYDCDICGDGTTGCLLSSTIKTRIYILSLF